MNAAHSETVLITGASSGIGLELARCFAADGCRLVLLARNTEALEALAGELRQAHKIEALVLTADLSKPEPPARVFQKLQGRGIAVDVLVNNAGFGANDTFAALPLQRQLDMIQVNITALTELTGLFLPGMIARRHGGVLNVGSLAGFQPGPGMAIYFATKAYVLSFTEALAEELKNTGLSVSVLAPGPTTTNFGNVAHGRKTRQIKTGKMTAEAVARYGHDAFRRRKLLAIPGLKYRFLPVLVRIMPRWLVRKIVSFYTRTKE